MVAPGFEDFSKLNNGHLHAAGESVRVNVDKP